jgi:hypothetical protein
MALESTRPLTEIGLFSGGKGGRCVGLKHQTTYLREISGHIQISTGNELPLCGLRFIYVFKFLSFLIFKCVPINNGRRTSCNIV